MNYTYLESTKKKRKRKEEKKKNRTEPIDRTKTLRLPHTHTHYKHTHTRMHRRPNQKRANNQLTYTARQFTNNNGQACKLCNINICELHVNESGLLLCAICIVTIINRKRKESTTGKILWFHQSFVEMPAGHEFIVGHIYF